MIGSREIAKHSIRTHRGALFIGVVCCLLLSACTTPADSRNMAPGGGNATTTSAVPTATPTIDTTLKNQGKDQLQAYQHWLSLLKKYSSDVSTYQQQYTDDQQGLQSAQAPQDYKTALSTLQTHVAALEILALKAEAQSLQQNFQQQVAGWSQQHSYYDDFNNTYYPLGFEYGVNGVGGWSSYALNTAQTAADYQQAIANLAMYQANFQAMMNNATDKTPYDQPHAADLGLMRQNNKMSGKVVVISLAEQAMRVYQDGALVNAFLVTTGRPNRPSLPGIWWVEGKQSPTVFKAGVPKDSPNWYPDTPIHYAMQYHSNGYYIHDSWWRANYGPGTNFPHEDGTHDPFSAQGSHGCVNLAQSNAAWLYDFVSLYTGVIIY